MCEADELLSNLCNFLNLFSNLSTHFLSIPLHYFPFPFHHSLHSTFLTYHTPPSPTFQLTETSSRYARKISGTTALQEALKEKQQHIEQLLVERDLERAEMAKATSHIGEVEKELNVFKAQHVQVGPVILYIYYTLLTCLPDGSHNNKPVVSH